MITESLLISFEAETRTYQAGETIFHEKDFPAHYYQIKKGKLNSIIIRKTGKNLFRIYSRMVTALVNLCCLLTGLIP